MNKYLSKKCGLTRANFKEKNVLTKWKSLRNCFRRALKENLSQTDGPSERFVRKRKKYIYYEDLLFLTPFIRPAESNDATGSDLSEHSEDETSDSSSSSTRTETTADGNEERITEASTLVSGEVKCGSKNSKTTQANEADRSESELNRLQNNRKKKSRKELVTKDDYSSKSMFLYGEDDDDEAFLWSLLPSLREFQSDQKLQLRIELLKTVLNFKISESNSEMISNVS